jgi:hypothetical protein
MVCWGKNAGIDENRRQNTAPTGLRPAWQNGETIY